MPRTPVYRQIVADYTEAIRSGRLRPGDKLPTIRELRELYRDPSGQPVSDTPVKTALRVLEAAGLIETHQGKGSFVARK